MQGDMAGDKFATKQCFT